MALATQCPHCHTTFRVAHDQLKLRAGLVRCGACKQIFNGIENLLPAEDGEARPAAPPVPPASPAPAGESSPDESSPAPLDAAVSAPGPEQASNTDDGAAPEPFGSSDAGEPTPMAPEDPLLRMTLLDFSYGPPRREPTGTIETPPVESESDALDNAIDELQQRPWRNADEAPDVAEADELDRIEAREYEEPAFVRESRRRQRWGRAARLAMAGAIPLLTALLVAQTAYTFRDTLAAQHPQARPWLASACRLLGCSVSLPAQIDYVSLESSELQTLSTDKNTFVLALLLLNRSETAEAWPHIELTLKDTNDKPVARRVFAPADYADSDIEKGFPPRSEYPVKLYFRLDQIQASGYRAYLFYP